MRSGPLPVHTHASTHADDITSVRFDGPLLLSASTDGALCVSDALQHGEDDAQRAVSSWGTSIARAGWGPGCVWAASDMETMALWTREVRPLLYTSARV